MSLSGQVRDDSNPVENAYVVAYNETDPGPNSHIITRTDKKGAYNFEIINKGDWKIGVYKPGYDAHPEIYYTFLFPGINYRNLDFILSSETDQTDSFSGTLELAEFNILPRVPNPFYGKTIIDFVLPESIYTTVDVLSFDGDKVTTLIDDELSSGYQSLQWDGTDNEGNKIANGVYLCRVQAHDKTTVLPITLLR